MSKLHTGINDEFGIYQENGKMVRKFLESFKFDPEIPYERDVTRFVKDNLITFLTVQHGTLDHNDHILTSDEIVLAEEIAGLSGHVSDLTIEIEDLKDPIKELKTEEVF